MMSAELLLGVFTNFLTSAASAVGIELARRQKVYQAITDRYDPDKTLLDDAVSDLRIAFGRAGELDERLSAFLTSVARSDIIRPLALAVWAGEDWSPLQYSLYSVYAASHPSMGHPNFEHFRQLTSRIVAGLRAYFASAGISKKLDVLRHLNAAHADDIRALVRSTQRRWDLRDGAGNEVLAPEAIQQSKPWLFIAPNILSDTVRALGAATAQMNQKLTVHKPDRHKALVDFHSLYTVSRVVLRTAITYSKDPIDILSDAGSFSKQVPNVVILGNPGGGKSTLAQGYCLALAQEAAEDGLRLPVLIRIREYYAARRRSKQDFKLSILSFVVSSIAQLSEELNSSEALNLVRALLSAGRCICIFDGLDEVIAFADREEVVQQVNRFTSQWPGNSYLITSRPQGYSEVPMSASFAVGTLSPFGRDDVTTYFRKIGTAVFGFDSASLQAKERRFLAEVDRNAADLIQTPLLLSLIIYLFHSTDRVPDNRAEIYRQCATMLFVDWDRDRKIHADLAKPYRLLQLLPKLAYAIYPDPILVAGVSGNWLRQKAIEFFAPILGTNDRGEAEHAATAFVTHLTGRAWVMSEKSPGQYEFTHRTFLEYFFAKELDEKYETIGQLIDAITPELKLRSWVVPCHIALQLKSERGLDSQNRCAELLLKVVGEAGEGRQRGNLVLFAAEACEYLQPFDQLLERIATLVAAEAPTIPDWPTAFISLLQVDTVMRESVFRGVAAGLLSVLCTYHATVLSPTIDWLYALRLASLRRVDTRALPARTEATESIVAELGAALSHSVAFGSIELPYSLKAIFDLCGELSLEPNHRYGHRLWQTSEGGGRLDWRILDYYLMLEELVKVDRGALELERASYARLALAFSKEVAETDSIIMGSETAVVASLSPIYAGQWRNSEHEAAFNIVSRALGEVVAQISGFTLEWLRVSAASRTIFDQRPVRRKKSIHIEEILSRNATPKPIVTEG